MKILAAFFSVVGPAFFWLMVVFLILEGFDRRPEKKGRQPFHGCYPYRFSRIKYGGYFLC